VSIFPIDIGSGKDKLASRWKLFANKFHLVDILESIQKNIKIYDKQICIRFGSINLSAKVYCNDENLLFMLTEYFKALSITERENVCEPFLKTNSIVLIYLADLGLIIDNICIDSSNAPYEGVYNRSEDLYIVSGNQTVGTFKSVLFGCLSSLLFTHNLIPVHSSVIVSPNDKCILFSGRGNWGKSTTLIAVMSYLKDFDFKVLTDDWAIVSEKDKKIYCMDSMVTLRQEIICYLPRLCDSNWIKELFQRFQNNPFGEQKPALNMSIAFGIDKVKYSGFPVGIVTISPNSLPIDLLK